MEVLMKKLVAIAALLMATTAAHAGGARITFQIDGQRIQLEAPRNCSGLSCIRIAAPGFNGTLGDINLKGLGSKANDGDDVASTTAQPPAPPPAPVAAAVPAGPIGIWATEENKGNVRVEQCGANLCGYSANTNERILINMRPDGNKWSGRIHDPNSGRNYDSTIAMKGPNVLRVQGCAFGGMFCGGQTWKRVS